ncbi:MAG: hypothetical protein F6K24_08085 [Okeania sp. SIO2D1]|nr:hypothetical protein [Okeania sp. SIO2D1]
MGKREITGIRKLVHARFLAFVGLRCRLTQPTSFLLLPSSFFIAENDPDEKLREWAKEKLQQLEN